MEKFTIRELEIFNLIKQGVSRSDLFTKVKTTTACVQAALCQIYEKTEDFVNYRTQRNKFEELQMFLRNNPTAFTPIPAGPGEAKKEEKQNKETSAGFKFELFQKVKINVLENIKGRVVSIWITAKGIKYEVRYFWGCGAKEVYFFEDELEVVNE